MLHHIDYCCLPICAEWWGLDMQMCWFCFPDSILSYWKAAVQRRALIRTNYLRWDKSKIEIRRIEALHNLQKSLQRVCFASRRCDMRVEFDMSSQNDSKCRWIWCLWVEVFSQLTLFILSVSIKKQYVSASSLFEHRKSLVWPLLIFLPMPCVLPLADLMKVNPQSLVLRCGIKYQHIPNTLGLQGPSFILPRFQHDQHVSTESWAAPKRQTHYILCVQLVKFAWPVSKIGRAFNTSQFAVGSFAKITVLCWSKTGSLESNWKSECLYLYSCSH